MNTKIMLALCAMIAVCTSVNAVESTPNENQMVKKKEGDVLVPADDTLKAAKQCFEQLKSIANNASKDLSINNSEKLFFVYKDEYDMAHKGELDSYLEYIRDLQDSVTSIISKYVELSNIMSNLYLTSDKQENKKIGPEYLEKKGSTTLGNKIRALMDCRKKNVEQAVRAAARDLGEEMLYLDSEMRSGVFPSQSFSMFPDRLIEEAPKKDGFVLMTSILEPLEVYTKELDKNKRALIKILDSIANA
jgi:hypothetical protein